jgi:hypothetical protein
LRTIRLSKEHFSVDGTLIQAWASHKSFVAKDGSDKEPPLGGGRNAQADWKGKPRSNDTHVSTTDPDARLYKKSDNTPAVMGPRAYPDREPLRPGGGGRGQPC